MMTRFAFILFTVFFSGTTSGQLCNGSLGDPVVNITFGTGSGTGPALPGASTSYTHTFQGCPNDGQYALANLSFNCFGNTWHLLAGDHTPNDANGYFMLVNASETPGDFYVDTIRGLCPNTTYEFATWIMNVLRPNACNNIGIDPNLTFTIETTNKVVLATYETGNIPEEEALNWKQYGVFFQTPVGITDVVIRLRNNAPGGCGNDLAIDDITFRPCGALVNAVVASSGDPTAYICDGFNNSFLISASFSGGYNNPAFQWQQSTDLGISWSNLAGATTTSYLRPQTGTGVYMYRMLIAEAGNFSSPQCRIASNPVTVYVNQAPFVQATNYVFGCYGTDMVLFAAGGSFYQWTGPNGFKSNQQMAVIKKMKFEDAGMYRVLVTTDKGCKNSDSTDLVVYPAVTVVKGPDVSVCEGVDAMINVSGGVRYKWYPEKGLSNDTIPNPIARPSDSTVYNVTIINEHGCFDTANIKVNVWKKPVVNAGPDRKTRLGLPIQLHGTVKGTNVSYYWSTADYLNNTTTLNPISNPPWDIKYKLNAVSELGCGTTSDEMFLKVYEKIIIPNIFSPNGDGIHDTWIIEPLELFTESVTEVYNRYGQVVYKSNGYDKPWDGTRNGNRLPVGVYYYVIDLKTNNEPKITGSITIIR